MKNILLKTTTLSIMASSLLLASGWRLPEASSKSVALSGAYIANSNGADSTYYNPANMSFNKNISQIEVGLMIVSLPSVKYKDDANSFFDGKSKKESSLIPSIFFTSKNYNNVRYGFSMTVPGGLTRRWDTPYEKAYAKEFALKIIEFNPTISYKVSNKLSLGGGLRAIYSDGVVKSDGTNIGKPAIRDMKGDTIQYGYNLALSYQDTKKTRFSLTYRSNIDLKEEGNAKLYLSGTKLYDGGVYVTVPLPAVLSFATSYDISDKLNVEVQLDRTYWSSYKSLDFEYNSPVPTALRPAFDDAKARDWEDTDALRVGFTYKYSNDTTLMFALSRDGNPVPQKSVSFESPDNTSKTISTGFDYKINDSSSVGFGYLFSKKDDRKVSNKNPDGTTYINGELTNAKAHLISFAYRKDF